MAKLTNAFINCLDTTGKDHFEWDDEVKGFGLRISKTGTKTFVFQYRVGGGRNGTVRRPRIGRFGSLTPMQAREIAKDWAAQVARGGDPSADRQSKRSEPRMGDLFERYLNEYARAHKKPRSVKEDERLIDLHLKPAFENRKVSEMSREHILTLHNKMQATPYQANRVLALMSKIMNLCEMWGLRSDGTNPCRHVKKFKEEKRERFLSPAELARLGDVLAKAERFELRNEDGKRVWVNPAAIQAIRLLILTGARCGEVLTLQWDMIDWERGCAQLTDSKSGRRALYLPAPALSLLSNMQSLAAGDYVIPGGHAKGRRRGKVGKPLTNIKDPWRTIRVHADLADVRLHDLRHSFASVGVASGFSLPVIGKLLGHRETNTTARYAHLSDDPVRRAVEEIGERVNKSLNT